MKKYLMTGMAALAICAAFTSCSKDTDVYNQNVEEQKKQDALEKNMAKVNEQYAAAFEKAFGKVGSNVDWGFGSSKASTRVSDLLKDNFTLPEFRDKDDITEPTKPTFATTLDAAKAAGAVYANGASWDNGISVYIDESYNWTDQNKSDLTIYVNGNVTYYSGVSNNGNGTTFVVLENSSLKLGSFGHNMKIYVAPGSKVDISSVLDWQGNPASWGTPTIEKSNAFVYLGNGSELKAGDVKFFDGAKILNEGGTITATNVYVDKNTTLWNEGTVSVSNKLEGDNENAFIYNAAGKTISAASFSFTNNTDLLVNDGTVTITNEIDLHNSGAEIVNNADMSCGSFSQAAGAKMHNVGNMNVTGLTKLDNNNSGWVNDGQWTCGRFEILGNDKGAGNNFNNCRLTVEGEFYLNREAFILDSDAGVECGSFKIDDTSGFYLGNNSVLKIDGTLTTEIINPEYGFFAYGSEYAAVQANSIVSTTHDPQSINYYGNLLVAINPHLPESEYTAESTVKFTKDNQNIATIPETPCNPGYQGDDKPTYRVIAEDLNAEEASDFDFNDVVFDVEPNEAGTAAKIVVRAAGGIYKLTVAGKEVHEAFGEDVKDDGLYPMINTKPWDPEVKATLFEAYPGEFGSDADIRNTIKNIEIKVYKPGFEENGIELTAQTGKPACKILVDQTFEVVTERTGIADKNTNFNKYVQGTWDTEKNGFWWKKN